MIPFPKFIDRLKPRSAQTIMGDFSSQLWALSSSSSSSSGNVYEKLGQLGTARIPPSRFSEKLGQLGTARIPLSRPSPNPPPGSKSKAVVSTGAFYKGNSFPLFSTFLSKVRHLGQFQLLCNCHSITWGIFWTMLEIDYFCQKNCSYVESITSEESITWK